MINRKIRWYLLALFVCGVGPLSAQDCDAIVLPKVNNDVQRLHAYPADKIAYYCTFSQSSFEVADAVAPNAPVHEISEVVDRFTGNPIPNEVHIDLNTLSYYQYDFNRFQGMHAGQTIYFHTPSSEHPYLVLVSYMEAERRTLAKMK